MLKYLNDGKTPNQEKILQEQTHICNYMIQQFRNKKGLRELILRRNNLGDHFASLLSDCLSQDDYIQVIDVAGN